MMDQISTLPGIHPPAAASSLTGEWERYADFLRRPGVPERATGPNAHSVMATLRLLLLDFALMAVLMAVGFTAYMAGVEFPQNELESLDWTMGTLALIVAGAPILEEVMFRGWMSGRPGHVLAVLTLLGGALVLNVDASVAGTAVTPALIAMAATLAAAIGVIYALRHRGPPRWYSRLFPVFFWLSALAFATIHIWNYPGDKNFLVLLLVLPQLVAGTIFGYARVKYGLWSSILLHMLHNATAVTLAVSMGEVMG